MRIGIIGPNYSCLKLQKDISIIDPTIQVTLYICERCVEAQQIIEQCEEECDGILFTGLGLYVAALSCHPIQKPYDYITKSSSSLMRAFLDMQQNGYEFDYFSIDVAEPDIIEDTFSEIGITPTHYYSMPFESFEEDEYLHWHLMLFHQQKIKVILTGFVKIYTTLKEQGYPVFYLPSPRSVVRISLERMKNSMTIQEISSSQLAIEIIRITQKLDNSENYYSNMLLQNQAANFIIQYAQQIQASFFHSGQNDYIIIASKGYVKSEQNYQLLYQLQHQISKKGFHIDTGIGIGTTAYHSEINAKRALEQAIHDQHIYLVDENDILIGPVGKTEQLAYELTSSNSHIIEIAQETRINPVHISKLMSAIQFRKNAIFDANMVADCLYISTRSARRIIHKLLSHGYASIHAKESTSKSGRPRNLFKIQF